MERTFHDLHLESSQGIVGQILQKLWWKEGIFHINSYLPLMVIARCGKFLLSIITFKVFDPQFSTTTLNEDHEKFFLERTYFLYFRTQIKEKWCFFRDLCGFIGVGGTSILYYFCFFYSPLSNMKTIRFNADKMDEPRKITSPHDSTNLTWLMWNSWVAQSAKWSTT